MSCLRPSTACDKEGIGGRGERWREKENETQDVVHGLMGITLRLLLMSSLERAIGEVLTLMPRAQKQACMLLIRRTHKH